jgi:hypothetical protein
MFKRQQRSPLTVAKEIVYGFRLFGNKVSNFLFNLRQMKLIGGWEKLHAEDRVDTSCHYDNTH